MTTQPDWRDERIKELEEENARLRKELAEAHRIINQLRKRIAELERRLGLSSRNSSKPPSQDTEKARRKRKRKSKTGRKPGGQKGRMGCHRRLWPTEQVDEVVELFPDLCPECGLELSADQAIGQPQRHQTFDVPPVRIQATEYQLNACQCAGCGHTTRAELPDGVSRKGWGPSLVALVTALTVVGRMTRSQCDWFVTEVLGAPSSKGTIQAALEEASETLKPSYRQAQRAVRQDPWTGLDETGWRLGRLPYWIWVAQSQRAAIYHIDERRTKEVANQFIGPVEGRGFITDRYSAYSDLPAEARQICHAHLLRQFVALGEMKGHLGTIGQQLTELEVDFQRQWARVKQGERQREDFVAWVRQTVQPDWERLLQAARDGPGSEPAVVRWLLDERYRSMAWTFLDYPGMEPTNNETERAVRGPVIQRKISWGSQSEEGLRMMERFWTVHETCRRQGRRLLDYLTEAISAFRTGQPPPLLVGD